MEYDNYLRGQAEQYRRLAEKKADLPVKKSYSVLRRFARKRSTTLRAAPRPADERCSGGRA